MDRKDRPTVAVLGGGLAGIAAAIELSKAGARVTILESTKRLGGKAGVRDGSASGEPHPTEPYEHGYHIFAPWYENVFELMKEAGVMRFEERGDVSTGTPALLPVHQWHYVTPLKAGDNTIQSTPMTIPKSFDSFKLLSLPRQFARLGRDLLRILKTSPLPPIDTLLYFYFVLDMIGEKMTRTGRRAAFDRVSRSGLMRDRWYATSLLPRMERESMLKATAIPVHEMSAFTAKHLSAAYLRQSFPPLFALNCDLETGMIQPLRRRMEDLGIEIRTETRVSAIRERDGDISGVELRCDGGESEVLTADAYVAALPLDISEKLFGAHLYRRDTQLGGASKLRVAPMAQLELHLNREIPGLPKEHTFLSRLDGRDPHGDLGISFIDQHALWDHPDAKEYPHRLACIAADFSPIRRMSADDQFELMLSQIQQFLPIARRDIAYWNLHQNTGPGEGLFINTVGSWSNRPRTSSKIPKLFHAGDWVRHQADLACMEGAVSSGRQCAHEVSKFLRESGSDVEVAATPRKIPRYPDRGIRWAARLLIPFIGVLKLTSLLIESAKGERDGV